jgi:multidrug efflux pump subunit AcrA (membrane-fusion protein)
MMTTQTLEQITKAEIDAQEAAAKALAAAQIAQARADAARERAEEERARAYKSYLDKIAAEWPAARETAITTVGETRAALEQAVRSGDDVFRAYLRWVEASVLAWEVDAELGQIRHHHGVPVRSTDPPVFNFGMDVGAIVDTIALDFGDAAVHRISDRRTAFVNGRTA